MDAEADAEGLFENIVYLIEFARARLETDISLSCQTVAREEGTHCAIGEIHYPPRGDQPGARPSRRAASATTRSRDIR